MGVVADHAEVLRGFAELPYYQVLGEVCVLILVDKHVAEILPEMGQYVGIVAKEHVGVEQQVVEVHRSGYAATVAVQAVDLVGAPSA